MDKNIFCNNNFCACANYNTIINAGTTTTKTRYFPAFLAELFLQANFCCLNFFELECLLIYDDLLIDFENLQYVCLSPISMKNVNVDHNICHLTDFPC